MKLKHITFILIMLFFFVLTACNDSANDGSNQTANDANISSISTDQTSDDFPHTQPIRTQDAKYEAQKVPNPGSHPLPSGDRVPNTNNIANQPQQHTQQAENYGLSQFENDVIALTNKERQQAGLNPLQTDSGLSQVAREKSMDMQRNGYFSHTSPTYGSPFDMMRDYGITYRSAGENIAKGQTSPAEVVQAWMNSQGHRENILNANFTHIGVGYEPSGQYWTQMFITK